MRTLIALTFGVSLACLVSVAAAQDADYELILADVSGFVDGNADLPITFTNTGSAIEAYAFDVCHDTLVDIDFGDVVFGIDTDMLEFDSHTVTFEDGGWSVAAVLETGTTLAAGDDLEMYIASYELLEEGFSELSFCGDFEAPLVTVDGDDIEPVTGIGSIDITVQVFDDDFVFSINDQTVTYEFLTGEGTFSVDVIMTENTDSPGYPNDTQGFSFGVASNPTFVIPVLAQSAGAVADLDPAFFSTVLDPDDEGITVGCVYDFFGVATLELDGESTVRIEYETNADTFFEEVTAFETDLEFTEELGDPAVISAVVVAGLTRSADFDNGTIALESDEADDPEPEFLRGDANGNGTVAALLDSLFILEWAFLGGDSPPCLDAADVDNNGTNFALLDSLFLLDWAFTLGDVPPDPGPDECGPDPAGDTDDIGCETSPDICTP